MEASQKDGRVGRSSMDLMSLLASSESVDSELVLDSAEPLDCLWLRASVCETVSRCWMLPRERIRPSDARRVWARVLTVDAAVRGLDSRLSAAVPATLVLLPVEFTVWSTFSTAVTSGGAGACGGLVV